MKVKGKKGAGKLLIGELDVGLNSFIDFYNAGYSLLSEASSDYNFDWMDIIK